ncbi:PIN domain-containing protein [Nakamurella antarctica]|uniref:PIN domain-containing protein n=1 Tax=Nakamurella antarctica TaxID=1902245 RepID=A0A3G8ZP23_9ACTN|nr:PIN domain-containing protein [Nakamurella antarctica]AZI58878.1 PIN domain-containing protein [Nakamurella antarctica]
MPNRVLVDANVLYSRTLRDWLCLLYLEGELLFSVHWTEDILAETIYRLRRAHPEWSGLEITKINDSIRGTFEGGRVDDFSDDTSYQGNDPNDRHVHAAAATCHANILLTDDAGFAGPDGVEAAELPYEIYKPDQFFVLVDDASPDLVRRVTVEQQKYWLAKDGSANLPNALRKAGCNDFAERVRQHLQSLV